MFIEMKTVTTYTLYKAEKQCKDHKNAGENIFSLPA